MAKEFSLDVDLLREVLDRLNFGVYVTDTERHILLWNRKAQEITGHAPDKVVGTACWDGVLNHIDKDGHRLCYTNLCPLHRAITLGRESEGSILIYAQKADGKRVPVSVSVAPLFDDAGSIVGGIETFRDESSAIADLEFAGKIQRSILPKRFPQAGDIRFDARYYPHDLVGGDFFDLRPLPDGRIAFLIADVRGHGVSAALYTMWLKNLEDTFSALLGDPCAFMAALNAELTRLIVADSFATALYGVVDPERGEVTYCDAGHPAMLHYHRATREVTALDCEGLPLGISADEKYASSTVSLADGDMLLLYTDGITDFETGVVEGASGKGKVMGTLGQSGLSAIFRDEAVKGPANLPERVYLSALGRCHQVAPADDVLVLSVTKGV